MRSFPTAKIRNVALAGHSGAGKTTLLEAILARTGQIERAGSIAAGTTVSDYEPEEARRQMSLGLSVAPVLHDGHKINIVDLPGYLDFEADQLAGASVADIMVIVLSGTDGIEVGTEAAWELSERLGLGVIFCVTKLDRSELGFEAIVAQLRDRFGASVIPMCLPRGRGEEIDGVIDLLSTDIDGDAGLAAMASDLVEAAVVADEELMERYLDGQPIDALRLRTALSEAVTDRSVTPATFAVGAPGATGTPVDALLDALVGVVPSPDRARLRRASGGGTDFEVSCDPDGLVLATVYKTVVDPYVGQLSYMRVLSGTVTTDSHLLNPRSGSEERLHSLFVVRGRDHLPVDALVAGDLGASSKLTATATGDTLAPPQHPVVVEWAPWPVPVHAVAIRPHSDHDDDKLMTALHRLESEDRSLRIVRDDQTHQSLLWGMGDTHLAVAIERLHRRFGVHVDTEEVRVAYRETVTAVAEAEGRHKKQSGGHGQFAVVSLRLEPLERGGGFEFADEVVGGAISHQFIPAVEKGVVEAMAAGGEAGYPVADVRVTVFDGKTHPVDSSELSFKLAAAAAFRAAFTGAHPVVLEPVSEVEVNVPIDLQGDIMGDLNSRRGRVQGTETAGGGRQRITALVPTAELARYAIDLRSLTGGRGRFSARPSHYDPMPAHLTARLVGAS